MTKIIALEKNQNRTLFAKMTVLVTLTLFVMMTIVNASDNGEPEERPRFKPIKLRSGFGDPAEEEEMYLRAHQKAVAEVAAARAENAKLVAAFNQSFVLAPGVREQLPEVLRRRIPEFNTYGVEFDLSAPTAGLRTIMSLVVAANGLGYDPLSASLTPQSMLTSLVNQAFTFGDGDRFSRAKSFFRIGAGMIVPAQYGLTQDEFKDIKAALFYEGGMGMKTVVSGLVRDIARGESVDLNGVGLRNDQDVMDLAASTAQFLYWAAVQEPDQDKKISYTIEAAIMMQEAAPLFQGRLHDLADKFYETVDGLYSVYRELLLQHVGNTDQKQRAVDTFLAYSKPVR